MSTADENVSADDLPEIEIPILEEPTPAESIVEFYVTNEAGEVVREGTCNESMFPDQAFMNGEEVHRGSAPELEETAILSTHVIARQQAYPSIHEQLDAIWKILGRNPEALGDEGLAMLTRIQSVKQTYPKDVIYKMNDQRSCDEDPAFVPAQTNLEN